MMMKNSLLVLMISLAVISCNKKSKSENVISGSSAYIGKTYSLCSNGPTTSAFEEIQFLNSENYTWKTTYYSNTDCIDADKTVSDLYTGKYLYDSSTGIFAELLLKNEMTLHSQALVDNIKNDTNQNCGFNDWEVDVPKDVTGSLSCFGGTFEPYTEYDEVPDSSISADVLSIYGVSFYP